MPTPTEPPQPSDHLFTPRFRAVSSSSLMAFLAIGLMFFTRGRPDPFERIADICVIAAMGSFVVAEVVEMLAQALKELSAARRERKAKEEAEKARLIETGRRQGRAQGRAQERERLREEGYDIPEPGADERE
ncbi:MAG: hypothetical protein OXC31_30430 [Spirochaetaceae bacterium]|nr:hypothetical protein [Spirochaetaceae bacterium]